MFFASPIGYGSPNLERGRGSHLQAGRTFPEQQHPAEYPPTTGTSFSQHYPQQGRSLNQTHSQTLLHPGVIDPQRRSSSISSMRTSSEGRHGPVTGQPTPLDIHHPLAPENRRGERHRERANVRPNGRQLEGGPPPPGLRVEDPRIPKRCKCCPWFC